MIKYTPRLNIDGVYKFTEFMMNECPRISCLAVRVLIDIIRNQGDSPANIIQRTTGDRSSTSAESIIKRLEQLNICTLEELSSNERIGEPARKRVYITPYCAELLGLNY